MNAKSHENLKTIRFAGELLPNWAQLLDFAARVCPVSEEVRRWFSRFTTRAGVDDSRTVIEQCSLLRQSIQENRELIAAELQRTREDSQPSPILGAWTYALDTMIQQAQISQTCSWTVEGTDHGRSHLEKSFLVVETGAGKDDPRSRIEIKDDEMVLINDGSNRLIYHRVVPDLEPGKFPALIVDAPKASQMAESRRREDCPPVSRITSVPRS